MQQLMMVSYFSAQYLYMLCLSLGIATVTTFSTDDQFRMAIGDRGLVILGVMDSSPFSGMASCLNPPLFSTIDRLRVISSNEEASCIIYLLHLLG